ncbi:HesA/MoeB/ThiF family protein [Pasteurella sp. PK-2025]|uniref:HesA/MoeB/ThiF family protein n=1 Tax=unclassified Pasteurella TaxID=2621516 RepID=UPI003C75DB57
MVLSDQEFLRYSRQLLLEECGIEGQTRLKQSRVLIVGLGGLGSPVAQYLAASGVGKLYLADFDEVDISNLPRQFLYQTNHIKQAKTQVAKARLSAVNPHVELVTIHRQLDLAQLHHWVSKVDVVLDCSDNMSTRHQVNQACVKQNKPLISGAAVGFSGQLFSLVNYAQHGCYACLYPDQELPHLTCKTAGILAPIVGTIGCLQALEALKYLLGLPLSSAGKLTLFDGKQLTWQTLYLRPQPHCPICQSPTK